MTPTQKSARPSFPQIYLQLALTLAERSTCGRLKVGTVITSMDYRKVLAVGYNVKAVFYGQDYRVRDSLELLKTVGIRVEQLQS